MRQVQPAPAALRGRSDPELVALTAEGDARAFGVLHDRHAAAAAAAARRVLGPGPAAEDVVQEAFVQLWREAGRYDASRGSLRSWLVVLVRSRAVDLLRYERVRTAASERVLRLVPPELAAAPADDEVVRRLRAQSVRSGLCDLPSEQGAVLGLLYLGGRTQAEVASTLDLPLGTVKGRTRLGLAKLRRSLEDGLAA